LKIHRLVVMVDLFSLSLQTAAQHFVAIHMSPLWGLEEGLIARL